MRFRAALAGHPARASPRRRGKAMSGYGVGQPPAVVAPRCQGKQQGLRLTETYRRCGIRQPRALRGADGKSPDTVGEVTGSGWGSGGVEGFVAPEVSCVAPSRAAAPACA